MGSFFSSLPGGSTEAADTATLDEPVAAKSRTTRKAKAEPISTSTGIVVPPRRKLIASEENLDEGLHLDVPAERYHADRLAELPTLSSSLAKVILDQTPRHARLAHPRLNPDFRPREDSKFALGSAAHEIILGRGGGFEVLPFDAYTTKAAKEARDAARDAGLTPILEEQFERANLMAANVRAVLDEHDGCENVFGCDHGASEVVAIWRDAGGPYCRAMIDWLSRDATNLWDLKTTGAGLDDDTVSKTIENLGYDTSAAFYLRAMPALFPDLAGRFSFRWVFVEDEAPHEARIFAPLPEVLAIGDRKAALAIAKWDRAMTTGEWPGWARLPRPIGYPKWGGEDRWMAREQADPDADRMVIADRPRPPSIPEPEPFYGEYPRALENRHAS